MKLDVSKAFVRPMIEFPFEVDVPIETQQINGDSVSFDPAHIAGTYIMNDDVIRLNGKLHTKAYAPCAVCLAPACTEMEISFEESFRKDADEEEDGTFRYEGKQLPLDHFTLTLVLLNMPMRFKCEDECTAAFVLKAWNEAETVWAEEEDATQSTYLPFENLKSMLDEESKKQ